MIGIRYISSYIPERYESNFDKKNQFEIDDDFIINKLGVLRVSRKLADEETSDMCVKAFHALRAKTSVSPAEIDCVIVCTQNPDAHGLPHTSAIVHGKLGGREDCASFDISLGCSGYVYGLSIAKSFLESNGFKKGLLFTADPYSKIINPSDKNTALLFGDAASVTLLSESTVDDVSWFPVKFLFGSLGKNGNALQNFNGYLEMNGRAIFNFSAVSIPVQIKELLKSVGIIINEVDLFLFHQGSKYIIDTLQRRMNLPPEKVPCNLPRQGNTVSSSIPMLLENYLERENLNKIVLSGFGVGLSWASCLIQRINKVKGD